MTTKEKLVLVSNILWVLFGVAMLNHLATNSFPNLHTPEGIGAGLVLLSLVIVAIVLKVISHYIK